MEVDVGFREIRVVEIREILRLWVLGHGLRAIARRGLGDRKTVRRYVAAAEAAGLERDGQVDRLDDEFIGAVVALLKPGRPPGAHGASWELCERHHDKLKSWLEDGLRLTKAHTLLQRHTGPRVPYRTLHRYAHQELGFRQQETTMRVDDCEPGAELQVDFGQMGTLCDPASGKARKVWALIFTAVYSRHQFVWLTYRQNLEAVITGFERAWSFFGGMFHVVIPDNMKSIVVTADAVNPKFNEGFLEYAQARNFVPDPTRVRDPKGKARVERCVPYVRESFFKGEDFIDLDDANRRAAGWCLETAGQRIHGTTARRPLEVFEAEARSSLRPAPTSPYDIPKHSDVTVHKDQHINVGKALYSVSEDYVGHKVHVRADTSLVRIYHRRKLIKTHPRQAAGGRSTDRNDFAEDKLIYAQRDCDALREKAKRAGPSVGEYAERILDDPAPWRRMRAVYRLLNLVRRYGVKPVDDACELALRLDVVDVVRIERMVRLALEKESPPPERPPNNVIKPRFGRPLSHFASSYTSKDKS